MGPSAPGAAFWRLWGLGIALAVAASLVFGAIAAAHAQTCRASFYGAESGQRTASGAPFRPMGLTGASRTLPFGTRLLVCLNRCAVVTITDRGPFVRGRCLDLARGAARAIGLERRGTAFVAFIRLN